MKIYYCQITYDLDFKDTVERVKEMCNFVDKCIIVCEKDRKPREDLIEELKKIENVILIFEEFKDNIPEFRNIYLEKAKELSKGETTWIVVSDPDERFNEKFRSDLRRIVEFLEKNNFDAAQIVCRERFEIHEWHDDLDVLKETPWKARESDYYKMLLFKLYPDLKYIGVGISKNVHETFNKRIWNVYRLPKEYYYEHIKSTLKIWRNAARNFFIGGGGCNAGELNPYWKQFRDLCKKYGIEKWRDFESAIYKGLPEEIEKKLIEFLQVPPTDWGVEMRETAKLYFAIHKEKITPEIEEKIKNPPKMTKEQEVEYYVTQCYFQALGRHPDKPGLEYWKWMILDGHIKKEDLPRLLMQSEEYRRIKRGSAETITVDVPVEVKVHLTDEAIIEILKNSTKFNEIMKRLQFVREIEKFVDSNKLFEEFFEKKNIHGFEKLDEIIEVIQKCKKSDVQDVVEKTSITDQEQETLDAEIAD